MWLTLAEGVGGKGSAAFGLDVFKRAMHLEQREQWAQRAGDHVGFVVDCTSQ